MNDPRYIPITMNLGTGHDAFRKEPFGMVSFDEECVFAIRLRGFTGLAN